MIRDWLDARALERAARIFCRREWHDAPGYPPVVADTAAHLRYRARALRNARKSLDRLRREASA